MDPIPARTVSVESKETRGPIAAKSTFPVRHRARRTGDEITALTPEQIAQLAELEQRLLGLPPRAAVAEAATVPAPQLRPGAGPNTLGWSKTAPARDATPSPSPPSFLRRGMQKYTYP